jgi:hypothetical protein
MAAQATSNACLPLGFLSLVVKRSVNCEPLSVRILLILIGEASLSRRRKIDAACLRYVSIDVHEDPSRGAVDGDEQVAACALVRHLGQILDIDVDEARLVVPEGLFRRDRFAFGLRNQILQARHAFALEKTGDTSPVGPRGRNP